LFIRYSISIDLVDEAAADRDADFRSIIAEFDPEADPNLN
jgi:hypothetical protein